jgi:DNA-binding PadR family transcriptional regulator
MDTVLSLPRIRILRTLRHFDWATAGDVRNALDLDDVGPEANAITKTFARLVDEQLIDRRGDHGPFYYRLNERGRAELRAYLAKTQITDRDEPDRNGGTRRRRDAEGARS